MSEKEFTIEIPGQFYSDSEGKPFENCMVCNKFLLQEGTTYVVEKALKTYKDYDFYSTVYEYAICSDCYMKMQEKMSEESKMNLQQYYSKIISEKVSEPVFINVHEFNLNDWLSKCFFKGSSIKEMKEYQVVAQFNGSKMMLNMPPMVIGEEALNEMAELLSEKTIDEMNDFRDKFLSPPPDIEELIYGKRLIML
jgi:hypothetical protein